MSTMSTVDIVMRMSRISHGLKGLVLFTLSYGAGQIFSYIAPLLVNSATKMIASFAHSVVPPVVRAWDTTEELSRGKRIV